MLITLLIMILFLAIILWAVNAFVVLEPKAKQLLNFVVFIVFLIVLLRVLGVWGGSPYLITH